MRITDEMAAGVSVKNVDTSPERDKKGDDSLHVERVEAAYQAWISFPHQRGVNNAVDAIRAALEAADAVVTEEMIAIELWQSETFLPENHWPKLDRIMRGQYRDSAARVLALLRGGAK